MADLETKFHESWLGMVQPVEGLVVSIPVLVDAQCFERQPTTLQEKLLDLAPARTGTDGKEHHTIEDLRAFLAGVLDLSPELFDEGAALPEDLCLPLAHSGQVVKPTMALRRQSPAETEAPADAIPDDSTPASRAGSNYVALVWDLAPHVGLPLDKPETKTGHWEYWPSTKFDRLLRYCRVPIGILTNREVVRLVYAPHGESTGAITFRLDDMATVGGRPILDAFHMLLSANRFFGVAKEHQLPQILRQSRERQANVTNELAEQVFEALEILLKGFEGAAERDGHSSLSDALEQGEDHLYGGLLTVLLRLVFLLYAEDRDLMPMQHEVYADHMGVLGLFDQLQTDHGSFPDSMSRRFGAWPRLIALFRAVFLGVHHGELHMPARHGQLFDPEKYPFLEGWSPGGGAPINVAEQRAAVRVPSIDDETIYRVLEKLLILEGQRLSYRALDVEQIGSVYEALMGYHVKRLGSAAVCLRTSQSGVRVWVEGEPVLEKPAAQRSGFLSDEHDIPKNVVTKLGPSIKSATSEEEILVALEPFKVKGSERAQPGRYVIQPGPERKRTSSHYTPRSLSAPIVRRTLEPLLLVMGKEPPSERLLNLKICDPAMGSGAFLVEACRFLADQVVAAWTREKQLDKVTSAHEDVVNHARRLVAQRCLYGVDKNPFAVNLAKLSLWLVTLAKNEPFTFLDHALRHGDSLVGLSLDQIRGFHWAPTKQTDIFNQKINDAVSESLKLRQQIVELAEQPGPDRTQEKERLLKEAEEAIDKAQLIGDLVVGAFFGAESEKTRKTELERRLEQVRTWLTSDNAPPVELREAQKSIREQVPVFHWMLEFPEVFYAERPDPLDGDQRRAAAWMDAFVGNPPFSGGFQVSGSLGESYRDWLLRIHEPAEGKSDLVAHFFRRAAYLIGSHGTVGLIATKTIAQGDTRLTGLAPLLSGGFVVTAATSDMVWPGDASVSISVVHLAKGNPAANVKPTLNGRQVASVDSRLCDRPERSEPQRLQANVGLGFQGMALHGDGFVLERSEREDYIQRDVRNAERIFPYIGGEDINTSPTQEFSRYAIFFGQMSLDEAQRWPDLLTRVRETVKVERDRLRATPINKRLQQYWWRYWADRADSFAAVRRLSRCLVIARVTKHVCFSFQPTDRIINNKVYVFKFEGYEHFSLLQSRPSAIWTRFASSTRRADLNFSLSDAFETFPFPPCDADGLKAKLSDIGQRCYEARAAFMRENQVGLTQTYNRLKDATCDDSSIAELRVLHEELDRAVLSAYGWSQIAVPTYAAPRTDAERTALERFEEEVIDSLFRLNAERAEAEKLKGSGAGGRKRMPREKHHPLWDGVEPAATPATKKAKKAREPES